LGLDSSFDGGAQILCRKCTPLGEGGDRFPEVGVGDEVQGEGGFAELAFGGGELGQAGELEVVGVGDGFDGAEGEIAGAGDAGYGCGFHVDGLGLVAFAEVLLLRDAGGGGDGGQDCRFRGAGFGGEEAFAGFGVYGDGGVEDVSYFGGGVAGAGESYGE